MKKKHGHIPHVNYGHDVFEKSTEGHKKDAFMERKILKGL